MDIDGLLDRFVESNHWKKKREGWLDHKIIFKNNQ